MDVYARENARNVCGHDFSMLSSCYGGRNKIKILRLALNIR